jgi:hypothetical protein
MCDKSNQSEDDMNSELHRDFAFQEAIIALRDATIAGQAATINALETYIRHHAELLGELRQKNEMQKKMLEEFMNGANDVKEEPSSTL